MSTKDCIAKMISAEMGIKDISDGLGFARFTDYKVKTLVDVGISIGPKFKGVIRDQQSQRQQKHGN